MAHEIWQVDQAQPVRGIVYSSKKRHPFQSKPVTYSDLNPPHYVALSQQQTVIGIVLGDRCSAIAASGVMNNSGLLCAAFQSMLRESKLTL